MNKVIFTFLLTAMFVFTLSAQAPQSFKYQAVVRDKSGQVLPNRNISLRISILQSTVDGPEEYQEVHSVTTGELGLVNIEVGRGKSIMGSMAAIDWGAGSHFLRIEMDQAGGTDFELMGISELLSVPYALYAEKAGNMGRDDDYDWQVIGNDVVTGHGGSYPSGNVGIGTTSPVSTLHLFTGTSVCKLFCESSIGTLNGNIGKIRLMNKANGDIFNISMRKIGGATEMLQSAYDQSSATWREFIYFNFDTRKYEVRKGVGDVVYLNSGNVGIGTTSPNPSAKLEINSSDQGFLPPRMTTNQMVSIAGPAEGLMLYNTDLKRIFWYNGASWTDMSGGEIFHPCPDQPVVQYEGQTYHTVQIGEQCWLRENLNYGDMADSRPLGDHEKYCYDNDTSNCEIYGGLYEWDAAMMWNVGPQGICPSNFHIPSDEEWKILEGTLDTQSGVGSPEWDLNGWRGYDAGGKMKTSGVVEANTGLWNMPNTGATNESGFTVLPGGYLNAPPPMGPRDIWVNGFAGIGEGAVFWSSTDDGDDRAYIRSLAADQASVHRISELKGEAASVRCLRDD
jgi:uncharacterized protein (TIGR02145 family)